MSTTLVDYHTDSGVAVITLDDPPMNAFTHDMMKELDECLLDARFDNDVHVIVLTGRGDRFFCAGPSYTMLSQVDEAFRYYFYLHASETIDRIEKTPKLVVAALNGHAVGGGLEMALACDLRIARDTNIRFGFPEVPLGLMPGLGAATRLTRLVGSGRAMQLIIEGTPLGPEQAVAGGIVHEAWETRTRETFEERIMEYARNLVRTHRGGGGAAGRAKRAILSVTEADPSRSLERELSAVAWGSVDFEQKILTYVDEGAEDPG